MVYEQFKETIVGLLVEQNRARKLRIALLGTRDALTAGIGKGEGR